VDASLQFDRKMTNIERKPFGTNTHARTNTQTKKNSPECRKNYRPPRHSSWRLRICKRRTPLIFPFLLLALDASLRSPRIDSSRRSNPLRWESDRGSRWTPTPISRTVRATRQPYRPSRVPILVHWFVGSHGSYSS